MNKNKDKKTPNKFVEILKIVFIKYNVWLAILALVTAFAYAVSSI